MSTDLGVSTRRRSKPRPEIQNAENRRRGDETHAFDERRGAGQQEAEEEEEKGGEARTNGG